MSPTAALVPEEWTPDHLAGPPARWSSVLRLSTGDPGEPDLAVRRLDLARPDWDLDLAASLLTDEELRRAGEGVPAVRRRRILMRAALRRLAGDLLQIDPALVALARVAGRPELQHDSGALGLSTSASGAVGLVAAARGRRIGIDVERVAPSALGDAVAERWLAPVERDGIAGLPTSEHSAAITRAWVQKEAVLKGEGVGLRADPAHVVTPLTDGGRVGEWRIVPVLVPAGYLGALASA